MSAYEKCVICGCDIMTVLRIPMKDAYECNCHNCGDYSISGSAIKALPYNFKHEFSSCKHLFSAYLREKTGNGLAVEIITTNNIGTLIKRAQVDMPKSINQVFDRFLLYMDKKTTFLFEEIPIDTSQPAIACAKNKVEFENILEGLCELNYLIPPGTMGRPSKYVLTLRGIERVNYLKRKVIDSNKVFVAMMFNPEMFKIYDEHISRAIIDTGYFPNNVSCIEYNDDICDQIIAQIRQSKFLVADITGQRGGVYYEAGFAYGLGLPVIWTCKEDDFQNAHFDVNHNNFIIWRDGEQLYERLKNRILATISRD